MLTGAGRRSLWQPPRAALPRVASARQCACSAWQRHHALQPHTPHTLLCSTQLHTRHTRFCAAPTCIIVDVVVQASGAAALAHIQRRLRS